MKECLVSSRAALLLVFLSLISTTALAQGVPSSITYQGKLTDPAGNPLTGAYTMQFKLFDAQSGGSQLWDSGALPGIPVSSGLFTVTLGSAGNPINTSKLATGDVWVEAKVGADSPLPRVKLSSVPFALRAGDVTAGTVTADKIPSGQVVKSLNNLKDNVTLAAGSNISVTPAGNTLTIAATGGAGGVTGSGTDNLVPRWNGTTALENSVIYQTDAGNVGIGTGSPTAKLTVGSMPDVMPGVPSIIIGDESGGSALYVGKSGDLGLSLGWTGSDYGWLSTFDAQPLVLQEYSGKVGIGVSAPSHSLTVQSWDTSTLRLIGPNSFGYGATLNFGDSDYAYIREDLDDNLTIHAGGRLAVTAASVGIGTTSPQRTLHVVGDMIASAGVTGESASGVGVSGDSASGVGVVGAHTATGNYGELGRSTDGVHAVAFSAGANGVHAQSASGDGVYAQSNTTNKSAVAAFQGNAGGYAVYGMNSGSGNYGHLGGSWYGLYAGAGGTSTIAAAFKGNVRLYSKATNNIVAELGEGLDFAEGFDVSDAEEASPGTVLVISPNEDGSLAISKRAYDRGVAGVVAGANGLKSGVRLGVDSYDRDVALAGRVYCNVDATRCAVERGDLLTTSDTPGYAMKATDQSRAQGAVLGKAMQSLPKGEKGQILVLVTLQ